MRYRIIMCGDLLVAFPGGAGAADCVSKAQRMGIPVRYERARSPVS